MFIATIGVNSVVCDLLSRRVVLQRVCGTSPPNGGDIQSVCKLCVQKAASRIEYDRVAVLTDITCSVAESYARRSLGCMSRVSSDRSRMASL